MSTDEALENVALELEVWQRQNEALAVEFEGAQMREWAKTRGQVFAQAAKIVRGHKGEA